MEVPMGDDFTVDLPLTASSPNVSRNVDKAGTKGSEGSVRRASHKKHRTGCQTCKRRHVKCDEGKPHCQRCIGSNHECEGYVTPAPIVRWRGASFRGFQIVNVNPTKTHPRKTPAPSEEKFALQFFRERTAKYWVSYFPDGPWSVPLLAAQESHEVLRRCCMAVGSLHAAMAYDAKAITFDTSNQVDNTSRRNFSLKQYTRALGLLREEIDSKNVNSQVVLLACIMLFIYECLQGRRQNLEVHLRHGLQLTKIQSKDHLHSDLVSAILIRLRRLYLLYGRPRPQVTPDTARLLMYSLAQPFQEPVDLNVLRECIGDLGPSVQLFRSCVINQMFPTSDIQEEGRILINKRMDVCLGALDKLEAKDREHGSRYRLAFSWLRMVSGLSWVFLQVAHTDDYTSFDAYHATFQLIIDTTSELLQDLNLEADPTSLIFSIDLGFIPTLFLTAIACRHPKMRRKAVDLLRKVPRMEGLWAAEVTAQAAEKVIEYEESHIPPESLKHVEDASHGYGIPAQCRVYDVDIRDDVPPKGPLGKLISLRLSPHPPSEDDPSLEHHI